MRQLENMAVDAIVLMVRSMFRPQECESGWYNKSRKYDGWIDMIDSRYKGVQRMRRQGQGDEVHDGGFSHGR